MPLYTFGGTPADVLTDAAGNAIPNYQVLVYRAGTNELVTALYEADGTTPIGELRSNPTGSPTPGAIRAFRAADVTAIEYAYNTSSGQPVRWFQAARELPQEAVTAARNALLKAEGGTVTAPVTFAAGAVVEDGLDVTGGATVDGLDVAGDLAVSGTFAPANLSLAGMRMFNPRVYGAKGDGTGNDSPAIQAALSAALAAGGGWVVVPSGTYMIGNMLRIYRNTRLTLMPGAEFRRNTPGTMLLNGDADQAYGGYSGHGNLLIEGGLWNMRGTTAGLTGSAMCISIGHAQNVTIRDLEVRDLPGYHGIEFNSTKNALAQNCSFRGYVNPGGRTFSEAVQIDLAKAVAVFGGFGPYDNTACEDITIRNCYVGPSGTAGTTAWPRGFGSHAATIGRWHKRIKVIGCTVEGGTQYAVGAYAWQDCLIQGNTFFNQGAGVRLWTNDTTDANATTDASGAQTNASQETRGGAIVGNTMRDMAGYDDAIQVRGEATGKLTGVVVSANTIDATAGGSGVRLELAEQCTVSGNVLRGVSGTGISMVNAADSVVSGNRVVSAGGSGIAAAPGTGMQIVGNSVRDPGSHGIHVQGGADVQVQDNWVKGASRIAGSFGIRVTSSADSILVAGNKVRRALSGADAAYGLSITSTCSNIRRYGNDLTGSGTSGPLDDQSPSPEVSPRDEGLSTYTATVTGGGSATYTLQAGDCTRLGAKLWWVNINVAVNAAGSGTSNISVALPFTPDRSRQQTLNLTADGVGVASQSTTGQAVILATGSGALIDRLRTQVAATGTTTDDNRILNVTGSKLLAGASINISGVVREA